VNPNNTSNLDVLRRMIQQAPLKEPRELDRELDLQHGWLLPYLLETDDFLWGRWHHWFETASAKKVIAQIPQIEWQRNDMGFKMLNRSLSVITRYGDWRGWNSWAAFDYFMDWLLFGLGHKGQTELPEEKDEYRGACGRLYQVFTLETLLAWPHDYFGDILAENHHGRHLGFFPTPMELCQLMAQMNCGGEDARTKSVCDPCVGTGRMLLAASNYSYRLFGADVNPTVIKATLINGFLYAPWLVRPFTFLDAGHSAQQSEEVSNAIVDQGQVQGTVHDAVEQWRFEPIKKRRKATEIGSPQELVLDL
jgi:hypothetical protein